MWSTALRTQLTLTLTSENHLEKRLWLLISINWPYLYLGQKRAKVMNYSAKRPWLPQGQHFFHTASLIRPAC